MACCLAGIRDAFDDTDIDLTIEPLDLGTNGFYCLVFTHGVFKKISKCIFGGFLEAFSYISIIGERMFTCQWGKCG